MAQLMTIKLLVEDGMADVIETLVAEIPGVIDSHGISSDKVAPELQETLSKFTYTLGDAFKPWVLFSPTADANGEPSYWSETDGWDDLHLATRYEPFQQYEQDKPDYGHNDAVLILDPSQLD